jgi:MarR family transcriptional regulator, organic hydroperoxide resistance regulator
MDSGKYILRESLGYLTGVSHWKLHKRLVAKFNKSGINVTPEQWTILISLLNEGDLYQSQLALSHKKDRAGIKRLVDQLVIKGFVSRSSSGSDARTNLIKLTGEGKKTVHVLNSLAKESLAEVLAGFTESEITLLKRLLTNLIDNID